MGLIKVPRKLRDGMMPLEAYCLYAFLRIPFHPLPRALVNSRGFCTMIQGNISARRLEKNTGEHATIF
jgi:hypothetical protein